MFQIGFYAYGKLYIDNVIKKQYLKELDPNVVRCAALITDIKSDHENSQHFFNNNEFECLLLYLCTT